MITITQLEYIVAVDTYRHFVTASNKCFVTQPTLSMQIKKLEEDLGVVLFDRTKQPVVPTQIGEMVIHQARRIIHEVEKINSIVDDFNNVVSGELLVGIIPSIAPYLLPLFISSFSNKYPQVKIKITEMLSEDIIENLKRDILDIGILVTPVHEHGIIEKPIFYEKMMVYVNKIHPLALQNRIQISDFKSNGLWLLSKGHCFRTQVMNLCMLKDSKINSSNINYESGSLETLKKMVVAEGGYTLIPELSIDKDLLNSDKALVKKIVTNPIREVGMIYSRNFAKKKLINIFHEAIKQAVPAELLRKDRGEIVEWRQ